MKDELRLLNALIGMAYGAGAWPTPLRAHGYQLTAMQRDVGVSIGGATQIVTPEAVFQSLEDGGCLVVESKSASLSEPQARRYWAMTAEDLVRFGACVEPDDLTAHAVAPVYFCAAMHTATLQPAIDHFNDVESASMPLVDYDNHRLDLRTGNVRLPTLHALFDAGIYFTEHDWPSRFVPFDCESPDGELVTAIMQEFAALILAGEVSAFTAEDLARGHADTESDGCVPFYDQLGISAKKRYRVRIADIVERFRIAYFTQYLDREKPGPVWTKTQPVASGNQITSFLSKAKDYTRRIQNGEVLPKAKQIEVLIEQGVLEELAAD